MEGTNLVSPTTKKLHWQKKESKINVFKQKIPEIKTNDKSPKIKSTDVKIPEIKTNDKSPKIKSTNVNLPIISIYYLFIQITGYEHLQYVDWINMTQLFISEKIPGIVSRNEMDDTIIMTGIFVEHLEKVKNIMLNYVRCKYIGKTIHEISIGIKYPSLNKEDYEKIQMLLKNILPSRERSTLYGAELYNHVEELVVTITIKGYFLGKYNMFN
jgi:hypothetical protein